MASEASTKDPSCVTEEIEQAKNSGKAASLKDKALKLRAFAQDFLNNPRYKLAQRIVWAICILWAGVIVVQSIPYYTYIGQGKHAFLEGRYGEAEDLFTSAMEQARQYGQEDPRYANALNNLGELYRKQAKFSQADPIYVELLAIADTKLPKKRQEAAVLVNNVAAYYRDKGDYPRALELYKKALAIWTNEVKKMADPNYAAMLAGLARVYKDQGLYTESEPLYKQALQIRESSQGADSPELAAVLDSLAGLYREEARYAESEALYRRALQIDLKAYGWQHADTATDANSLAGLLRDMNKLEEAEQLYAKALNTRLLLLGENHPQTVKSFLGMAELRRVQSRLPEAETLAKRGLKAATTVFRTDQHPDCATCLNTLSAIYLLERKNDLAQQSIDKAIAIRKKTLPKNHPDLALSYYNQGKILLAEGKRNEAKACFEKALGIQQKSLTADHPDLKKSVGELAKL